MAGRRPTPTHLRLLQGNPQHRPINKNEPQPTVPENIPDPPDFITGYAMDEWYRVVAELLAMRVLTNADLKTVEVYCQHYARWREAEEVLARVREGDPVMRGFLIKSATSGVAIENPLVRIARQASLHMLRCAVELGLTPSARAGLSAGSAGNAKSRFGDMLV